MKGPGEPARLTYDSVNVVDEGDYVRTRTGRTYLVTASRPVVSRVTRSGYRWVLDCVVMEHDHVPEDDAVVHPLYWYTR